MALLLADDDDGRALKPAKAADDRLVLAEIAVAGERGEVGDEAREIVAEARPAPDRATWVFCQGVSAA